MAKLSNVVTAASAKTKNLGYANQMQKVSLRASVSSPSFEIKHLHRGGVAACIERS